MNRLLQLLQDGRFHSGQELGEQFGMSRSSIWKHLQRLESEMGLQIYRVPGRGYRLAEPLSLLDPDRLAPALARLGWALHLGDSFDSTNAEALRLLQSHVAAPFLVAGEVQTQGRGRRGRQWISPYAQNLCFSLAVKVAGGTGQLAGMSLVVGLAVMQALRAQGVGDVGVKWPNDVYAAGRKIAGILLELTGDPADVCHVVIGVGVNVNMLASDVEVGQPWTSVRRETGMLVDRSLLLIALGESLQRYLARHAEMGFAALREEWEAGHLWQGRSCTLSTGSQEHSGIVVGVDEGGALRLAVGGCERSFSGGELSLRLDAK